MSRDQGATHPVSEALGWLDDLPPGTIRAVTVGRRSPLLAHVDGRVYATGGQCPGSVAPLGLESFSPPLIVCPWHNEAWDVGTGARVDGTAGRPLPGYPVAVVDVEAGPP